MSADPMGPAQRTTPESIPAQRAAPGQRDASWVPAPQRLLALWLPQWPVTALTWQVPHAPQPACEPVAVVESSRVVSASPAAIQAGVTVGMRVRQARYVCSSLHVLQRCRERERTRFEEVMRFLEEVVAHPVLARPGLVLSSVGGPARWAGGEEPLAAELTELVTSCTGLEAYVGIADSALAAALAARQGIIVPPGHAASFLASWPLESVTAVLTGSRERQEASEVIQVLRRLGVCRLGDLARLGGGEVAARFGPMGAHLHDLATARSTDLPHQDRAEGEVGTSIDLDPPARSADEAVFAIQRLATQLCEALLARGRTARTFTFTALLEDGTELSRDWAVGLDLSQRAVADRLRWQMEAWTGQQGTASRRGQPGSGGAYPGDGPHEQDQDGVTGAAVVRLAIRAGGLLDVSSAQEGLWSQPGAEQRQRVERSVARLEALLGPGHVHQPVAVPGRDPRSRVRLLPWGQRSLREVPARKARERPPWSDALPSPSPARVLEVPQPVTLSDAHGQEVSLDHEGQLAQPPAQVTLPRGLVHLSAQAQAGQGASAGELTVRVTAWAGPWPMEEGWWRAEGGASRAYLQILVQGSPPLLLARSGRWWLDAVYE